MKKVLSKLPIPGRKPTASERLSSNNNWQTEPDFTTALSDSDGDEGLAPGAALTSANLRAHNGRPVTNEGQRRKRAGQNAQDWIQASPAPKPRPGKTLPDTESSADESSTYAAPSRLDPVSSRLEPPSSRLGRPVDGTIQPFRAREHKQEEEGSSGDDIPLGQKMFNELTRQRSVESSTQDGKRKKSAKRRGESAGRKVTYNLTDDSESMDDLELVPQRSGLLHGIHRGPSYHDPLENEISGTLDVYSSRAKVSKSRGSSRGGSRGGVGFGGLDSERSMLSTMDSPHARARALAEADDLMNMYAQPKGSVAKQAPDSHRSAEPSTRLPSSSNPVARPKSVLRSPSVPQDAKRQLQYADGMGGFGVLGSNAQSRNIVNHNISDSEESEDDSSRRVRSRSEFPEDSSSMRRSASNGRVSTAQPMARSPDSRSTKMGVGYSGGATETLARTLNTINKRPERNPEYLPDLDDSDSDVLKHTDSDTDGNDQPDTMRRLEIAHAKTAPFSLGATNDFDSFMKSVDKSVNKAVKVEKRAQKSRSSSRPGSRASSRGTSRGGQQGLPSRSGSRADMRRQQAEGPNVVSTSTSNAIQPQHNAAPSVDGPRGYVAPQRPDSQKDSRAPTVVKELGASVGLRRQHLAQIENGRVIPNSPQTLSHGGPPEAHIFSPGNTMSAMRRPMTTQEDIMLAEQQEEMELLMQQQQVAIQKEREQQEILNRLKRDKTRRESKKKDQQQELEQLWEEQASKDDLQYRQQKEIERLRHTLQMRDQREQAQQEELDRLRRDVSERARADAEGAMAFDKLLAEKHKKLLLTPAEIRQQVDEKMQREQLQREHQAEVQRVKEAEARTAEADVRVRAREEQIARDGQKYAISGVSNADAVRHTNASYNGNGNHVPSGRGSAQNSVSPSQLSRPGTQLSKMQEGSSRPGTAATNFTVDSATTSIREVREASAVAMQVRKEMKEAAALARAADGDSGKAGAAPAQHKLKATASKETPDIAKERHQVLKKLNLDQIKSKHDKAPVLKKYEMQQEVRDHTKELQRASDDARHRAELAEAQRFLEGPQSRARKRAASSASNAISRVSTADPALQEELERLEAEKFEFDRRERLHEEYIEQLKFEQEEKLEREAAKRKALQQLRGENSLIDRMLKETDQIEGGLIKEVGTLEALKEQFRRKQKLAEQLKQQQAELAEKQREREAQLKTLKSEVSKASDAAGIQLMQMNRLKAIQDEAIYMQEQQHKELENLKAELKRKADLTGEQAEIARLRAEAKKLEQDQAAQREKLRQEKESLEQAMRENEAAENEMKTLKKEKERREEAERHLRQTMAMEEREMEKLREEADKRKAEIEALQLEKEARQKELEGAEKEVLQQDLEDLRKRKEQLAEHEAQIARERNEVEALNRQREKELQELEALRKRSEEIEREQARAKKAEEEALRIKENRERARLRQEEDRIRAALEYEAQKAQQEMEKERKRRQNEIDKLKKQIETKKISEAPLIEEDEEEEEETPADKKVSDWLQSNDPDDLAESVSRAKKDKKKKKSAAGDITARSMNDADDDGGGNMTDRSDGSGKGPPTQWRLARHGKIKELEAMLTAENVDDRDGKGNTCLHHSCMQGKKRVAKLVLRLGADINAQNRRGHTCLHYCFAYHYDELGEYLISKGADESIKNELGATCREVESGSVTQR